MTTIMKWMKKLITNKGFLICTLVCYAMFVFLITTISADVFLIYKNFEQLNDINFRETFWHANNFVPFHTIWHLIMNANIRIALNQIVGNIIMFVPLGFFLVQLFKVKRLKSLLIIGASASVGIELIQCFLNIWLGFSYRSVDVDDVILNTIGAGLGGYFTYLIRRALTN
jgi:glycopeptide antibiotics resistance protein